MKNIRNIVVGIVIGLIISLPVNAAVQYTLKQSECKIVVDGVEVKGELPLLIMEPGYNYIPAAEFRSICDKIGIGFEFDNVTKEIRITAKQALPAKSLLGKTEDVDMEETTLTPDGLKVTLFKGENYIRWGELKAKSHSLGLTFDMKNNHFNFKDAHGNLIVSLPSYSIYNTNDFVKCDDYINIALPILEGVK